jgi:hypothetical protein
MIVWVLLILVLAVIGGFAIALAVTSRRDFRKQNQVVPGVDSKAPASWAGSHTPEARLHRRLRDAVAAARTAADVSGVPLDAATTRIDAEATALDDRLVAAAALPAAHRDEALGRLEPLVASLEDTVAALVERVSITDGPAELTEKTLDDTDIALEALARAREEVERIERGGH